MKFKRLLVLIIILIAVGVAGLLLVERLEPEEIVYDENAILFEKSSGWGPCPSEETVCYQYAKLFYSGKLILEGAKAEERQIDKETINRMVEQIRESGIMQKNCPTPVILDYWATYKINIDDQSRTIEFPGCENDLREIEKLIALD